MDLMITVLGHECMLDLNSRRSSSNATSTTVHLRALSSRVARDIGFKLWALDFRVHTQRPSEVSSPLDVNLVDVPWAHFITSEITPLVQTRLESHENIDFELA